MLQSTGADRLWNKAGSRWDIRISIIRENRRDFVGGLGAAGNGYMRYQLGV